MHTDDRTTADASSPMIRRLDAASKFMVASAVLLLPLTSNTVAESRWSGLTTLVGAMLLLLFVVTFYLVVTEDGVGLTAAIGAAVVLPPAMTLSYFISPSGAGAILTIFAVGALGVAVAVARITRDQLPRYVALPLLVTSSVQALLVIAQTITDRAIGLTWIDPRAQLHFIDGLLRPQGTMHHVYEPAALALLTAGIALATTGSVPSAWRWGWAGGAALAGTTVGLTHSRAALLGLLLMAPFVLIAAYRNYRYTRLVGGAFLAGFIVAAVFTASAWALRGDQSVADNLDDASLGRVTLMEQAITMTIDHPIVGVGPGRYLDVMRSDYELDDDYPFIVHNVTLAVAAENGIPVALIASLLVGWAVVAAIRTGPLPAALAMAPLGFLVFDVLHYNRPVGLLMTAIWLGVLHTNQGSLTSRRTKSS